MTAGLQLTVGNDDDSAILRTWQITRYITTQHVIGLRAEYMCAGLFLPCRSDMCSEHEF